MTRTLLSPRSSNQAMQPTFDGGTAAPLSMSSKLSFQSSPARRAVADVVPVRAMHTQYILTAAVAAALVSSGLSQTPGAAGLKAPSESPSPSPRSHSTPDCRVVDVCDLLQQYGALTHLKVIRDNFVQGKVSIDDVSGLQRDKAIEIIERTLFSDGFSITDVDPNTVEVTGTGKNARAIGVPVFNDVKALPTQERLVSFVFGFKYRDAKEMQQIVAQHLSPPKMYTSFIVEPKSNTLLVTERTTVIRKLIDIIAKMDVPDWKKEP
jgi:type II secretory pathway component GspD/PulD (secretin)